ncbi:MAG: reverse transcriptase domain-containing protein [Gemmatimonadales bacterium]
MPRSARRSNRNRRKGASREPVGALLRHVASPVNLRASFTALRGKKNARGGVDDVSISQYEGELASRIPGVRYRLRTGTYRFSRLRPVAIGKRSGGYRPILVPTVEDRLVQRAILRVVYPEVASELDHPNSHAYLPGGKKGVHSAVEQVVTRIKASPGAILIADIADFFPTVDLENVLGEFNDFLSDQSLAPLLTQLAHWEVDDLSTLPQAKRLCFPDSGRGLPQGSVLSPMLANFFLRDFDRDAEAEGLLVTRFADDLAVVAQDRGSAIAAHSWIQARLAAKGLVLPDIGHPKVHVIEDPLERGFDYLGLYIRGTPDRVRRRPSRKVLDNALARVDEILNPDDSLPLPRRYVQLSHFVASWLSAYKRLCGIAREEKRVKTRIGEGLERLLRERGLLGRERALSPKHRHFLGIDSLF